MGGTADRTIEHSRATKPEAISNKGEIFSFLYAKTGLKSIKTGQNPNMPSWIQPG